jgi:hypothetical protein
VYYAHLFDDGYTILCPIAENSKLAIALELSKMPGNIGVVHAHGHLEQEHPYFKNGLLSENAFFEMLRMCFMP